MDNEDKVLFREFVKGIKPFKQDKITFTSKRKQVIKQKQQIKEIREKEDALFYFSDEYEPLLDTQTMRYLREGEDSYILKRLRRGDFIPDLFLDLHGLTKEQAKQELASLILACEREHLPCACIMTGYGNHTLKNQIPRWLVQHPKVIALHYATKEWGGDAAIFVLIDVGVDLIM